jgi:hypothetical protein
MKTKSLIFTILTVTALAFAALPTSAFAATDTTGPIASAVAAAPNPAVSGDTITVTATIDDSTTGASNIASAEYNVNGGTYTAMTATDGAFDTATEAVTASFTVADVGDNQVCVHGTDAAGNTGADVCATLTVESIYTFGGFKPPVRTGVVNNAQSGRTVPLKFTLKLTADGSAVSDPAAIDAFMSYQVDCTTLTGDSSTAIEEKSPGNSGLRYQNRGAWIFNWKTDKKYAGTCRNLYVLFGDGSTSPEVTFQFR